MIFSIWLIGFIIAVACFSRENDPPIAIALGLAALLWFCVDLVTDLCSPRAWEQPSGDPGDDE